MIKLVLISLWIALFGCGSTDATQEEPCDPYCHWDCFGGTLCLSGVHYLLGTSPRPCCHYGDPWPDDGPFCSIGVLYECEVPACIEPEPRFGACLDHIMSMPHMYRHFVPDEFFKTLCQEGQPHRQGDPCETTFDCRPAAQDEGPLGCNLETHRCVEAWPVLPPDGFGETCGLSPDDVSDQFTVITSAPGCDFCHVGEDQGTCLQQACTKRCAFDEDCPEGYRCVCETGQNNLFRICAATDDVSTPEARASGLPCR